MQHCMVVHACRLDMDIDTERKILLSFSGDFIALFTSAHFVMIACIKQYRCLAVLATVAMFRDSNIETAGAGVEHCEPMLATAVSEGTL